MQHPSFLRLILTRDINKKFFVELVVQRCHCSVIVKVLNSIRVVIRVADQPPFLIVLVQDRPKEQIQSSVPCPQTKTQILIGSKDDPKQHLHLGLLELTLHFLLIILSVDESRFQGFSVSIQVLQIWDISCLKNAFQNVFIGARLPHWMTMQLQCNKHSFIRLLLQFKDIQCLSNINQNTISISNTQEQTRSQQQYNLNRDNE